jgi:hypothetical protein
MSSKERFKRISTIAIKGMAVGVASITLYLAATGKVSIGRAVDAMQLLFDVVESTEGAGMLISLA